MIITIFNIVDSFLGVANLYHIFRFSSHPLLIYSSKPNILHTFTRCAPNKPLQFLKHTPELPLIFSIHHPWQIICTTSFALHPISSSTLLPIPYKSAPTILLILGLFSLGHFFSHFYDTTLVFCKIVIPDSRKNIKLIKVMEDHALF
jgi:hypothetical protein